MVAGTEFVNRQSLPGVVRRQAEELAPVLARVESHVDRVQDEIAAARELIGSDAALSSLDNLARVVEDAAEHLRRKIKRRREGAEPMPTPEDRFLSERGL